MSSCDSVNSRDIDLLRSRYAESGFVGVYPRPGGSYVATVRMNGKAYDICRNQPSAALAASKLARWYADTFGDQWKARLKNRKRAPWRTWRSKSRGGWLLCVWEFGQRTEVQSFTRRGRPTGRLQVFETRQEAQDAVMGWVKRRYGMFSHLVLWRADQDRPKSKSAPGKP